MWQTGNIRVARISGIAIEIHVTFFLVILWSAWQGSVQYGAYGAVTGAGYGVLLMCLLFGCILLHELGHGLQARAFGLVVRRITLLPIGGLAQLETPPIYPWQELLIALAGPLVNFALVFVFGLAAYVLEPFELSNWGSQLLLMFFAPPSTVNALMYLVGANLVLFVFNMLPAFPMDGGRVLRAALALAFDYELATRISAWLGRVLAMAMGVLGLVGLPGRVAPNPLLLLVGIMVFFGARQEESYVRRQRALVRVEVREIAHPGAEILAPWDTITMSLVTRLFKHESAVPVVVEDRVVGLLTYHDLRRIRRNTAEEPLTVAHAMRAHFPVLRLSDTLWVALQEMNSFQLAALPIVENGIYQGIVKLDDINHAWRIAARRRRPVSTLVSGDAPLYD